ncbi:hypothetical protein [Cellulomonas sp. NS3]|uniref:hypothetical protein n=1 Tax=Cellulomonas sp. NS3 TaxID=2973977 RepID=UPI0021631028|nr:hypothetical protein [Cellulomonas sp. NS3]
MAPDVPAGDQLMTVVARMGGLLLSEGTVGTTLDLLTSVATHAVPGAAGAGVTLSSSGGGQQSVAASGDLVLTERQSGTGTPLPRSCAGCAARSSPGSGGVLQDDATLVLVHWTTEGQLRLDARPRRRARRLTRGQSQRRARNTANSASDPATMSASASG